MLGTVKGCRVVAALRWLVGAWVVAGGAGIQAGSKTLMNRVILIENNH